MIEIRETLTQETMEIRKGTRRHTLTKAHWAILKNGQEHLSSEVWLREKEREQRQTTSGTGVPETLRTFYEREHKANSQKERGIVRILQEIKGDGKASVLIILEIDGEQFLWNRDINKGRAVKWAKGLTQALNLYMAFPMKASELDFENTDEEEYEEPLAYRGKELTLVPSSYKKKAKEEAEGALADMQEKPETILTKEETEEGITITALQKKTYKELQEMAKEAGIKANQKRDALEKELLAKLA